MIFVNFKTYQESSGENAKTLTSILQEVSTTTPVEIIPVVQELDLESVIKSTPLDVWVQHIDPIDYGAHTGWTLPQLAQEKGAQGVFLNHSEHKLSLEELKLAVEDCKKIGLKTLVFAADLSELQLVLALSPDYVSYEPAELVGSTTASVTSEKPEIISQAYELTKAANIPLIVGAGIHSTRDVSKSLELGAAGIAVATYIIKSDNPKQALLDLVKGFIS